jgi:hypothetical protein
VEAAGRYAVGFFFKMMQNRVFRFGGESGFLYFLEQQTPYFRYKKLN